MRLRPYIAHKDYEYISGWISDERTHAMWCGDRIPYPLSEDSFHGVLEKHAIEWTDSAYVATEDDGTPVGFFCYSVDIESNAGFLRFVLIDSDKRGRGYGREMLRLALRYAFLLTGVELVQLNVFDENTAAKHCYESVGLTQRSISKDAFSYQDELWSRCNMIASNPSY